MKKPEFTIAVILALVVGGFCTWTHADTIQKDVPAKVAQTTKVVAAKPGEWTQDWDAALQVAKAKKLPVLVNFTGSDWCGWCKLMDREVFVKEGWKKYAAKKLMLVKIDFPGDKSLVPQKFVPRNEQLAKKFGIRGFPTFVLLAADGVTELGRLHASRTITPEIFIGQIEEKIEK